MLRWTHPALGVVSPTRFIPIAEECGLILPIGHSGDDHGLHAAAEWLRLGLPLCVAVNLSQRQFTDPQLVSHVREALNQSGLPPSLLELEITEKRHDAGP